MSKLKYLTAVVIVHGKSELQLCSFIKSNLKLKIHIESDKKGEKCIQITSILKRLNSTKFRNNSSFLKNFDDIELIFIEKKKKISTNFKIFIIMDTDDCTDKQRENFINKVMFKEHWAFDYIHPIYNKPNLEEVLIKSGINYEKKGIERKKEYIKIFPTDKKYLEKERILLEELQEKLMKNKNTNMNEFLEFCLKYK